MSRFDEGRWNRILVWTGAGLAWCSALIAGPLPLTSSATDISGAGASETIGAKQTMPDPPNQGLIVIRLGREPNSPPVASAAPAPQPSASAPEITSSGS
ncbi:MAG: hypothetical protein K0T01_1242 [Acidimicrobiia bacterium]|jgi:hypothetical protein|nr:hypothetical protein [Acidimicrobiia bacterium]